MGKIGQVCPEARSGGQLPPQALGQARNTGCSVGHSAATLFLIPRGGLSRTPIQPWSALLLEDVPFNIQPLSQAHRGRPQTPLHGSFRHHPQALSPEPDPPQLTLGSRPRPHTVLASRCSSSISKILTPQYLGSLSHSLTEKAQVPKASREVSHLYQDPPVLAPGHKQLYPSPGVEVRTPGSGEPSRGHAVWPRLALALTGLRFPFWLCDS